MIEGLPKSIPRKELEKQISAVFLKILGQKSIVGVSVVSDYSKCLDLIEQLKIAEVKYSQIVQNNEEQANLVSENPLRYTVSVRPGFFQQAQQVDGEKYY